MKRTYIKPRISVVQISVEASLLGASASTQQYFGDTQTGANGQTIEITSGDNEESFAKKGGWDW